jgi:hypothetical protein
MCYAAEAMLGRLSNEEKRSFAESIMQLGNGVCIGLVVGQAFLGEAFSYLIAGLGFILLATAYWVAYLLLRERR